MSKSKIKIYVTCFNNKITIPDNDLFELVQGGAANSERRLPGMLHDDKGDNISKLNPRFNDAATIYWAWKNFDNDYYGFFQYRRFLSFNTEILKKNRYEYPYDTNDEKAFAEMRLLDAEKMRGFIEQYDVITCNYLQYDKDYYSLYQQFCEVPYEREEDLNLLIEVIQQRSPEFMPAVRKYLFEDGKGYFANLFIMRKEYFHQLCEWMFDILFEFDRRMDYNDYTFAQRRVPGYCSERLLGIFYTYLQMNEKTCKFGTLQKCFFQTTREQPLDPIFPDSKRTVPIVLSASKQSLPYCNVTVQSIINHMSPDLFYDIVILHEEITSYAIKRFVKTATKRNCSIRFANVSSYLVRHKLREDGAAGKEDYYRFVLCDVMGRYDKAIYLDSGVIALEDIAHLKEIELNEYALAAVVDTPANSLSDNSRRLSPKRDTAGFQQECLQTEVLLFNVEEFSRLAGWEQLIRTAEERAGSSSRDILNCTVQGRVKRLDAEWNVAAEQSVYRQPQENGTPKIIRYAGSEKPWNNPKINGAELFWETAKSAPLYSDIVARQQLKKFDRYFPGYLPEADKSLLNKQPDSKLQKRKGEKESSPDLALKQNSSRPWECILEEAAFPDTGLSPAFEADNIAIELLSSAYYLPYLAVTIQSIIESGDSSKNYDIIVFTDGIPKERQKKLKRVADGYSNVSIRFADVSQHLALLNGAQLPQYAKLIYCRVWMAHILKNYDQIICVDSDMVVTTDVSIFADYDFGDDFVLAAHEWCYGEYGDELGLDDCTKTAINAGFMVMNLKKIREIYPAIMMVSLCNARGWRYMDQDILNILFQGKIQYLDYDWNFRMDYDSVGALHITECLNNPYYQRKSPKIIHFAGEAKPWKISGVRYEEEFWDIAERSKFYREIMVARISTPYSAPYPVVAQPKRLLRIDHPARKYLDALLPKGTKRREFIKKILRFFIR
ncbi:glycosyltransferase [Pseudoflavonifractor sp. 524-17]|uniref:glycosyltransferase n=1 Tax=Pseudoflavonifractor sp. 524-17 TaxID=2304577 RepID=UPI00137B0561